MTDFVEECRREWKRLHVPEPLANEMAADLAADLQEAEADGASTEDVLGNAAFDPRAFAESWARERGLTQPRLRGAYRGRTVAALGAVLAAVIAAVVAVLVLTGRSDSRSPNPVTSATPTSTVAAGVSVPNLVGLSQSEAIARARAVGASVSVVYVKSGARHGAVVSEQPAAGTTMARGARLRLRVSR